MKHTCKNIISLILAGIMLMGTFTSCEGGGTPAETSGNPGSGTETSGSTTEQKPEELPDPVTFYVAPDGDDGNEGTPEAPLATLDGAKQRVREIKGKNIHTPVTVYFREGTYVFETTSDFTESDSGTPEAPVVYCAYEGEKVVFSGAKKIDASLITPAEDEIKARVIDEEAGKRLMKIDMTPLADCIVPQYCFANGSYNCKTTPYNIREGIENCTGYLPASVYAGDTELRLACWPNNSYQVVRTPVRSEGENENKTVTFGFMGPAKERIEQWSRDASRNLYLYGNLQFDWTGELYDASDLDFDEMELTLHGGGWYFSAYPTTSKGLYFFMNLPEEIDLPGESYMDYDTNVMYFLQPEDFDPEDVCINVLKDHLIAMNGTKNVVFDGIVFSHTRNNAIYGTGVDGITVQNGSICHVGNQLVNITGNNVTFRNCDCYDAEHGGIYLFGGDRVKLESTNDLIEDCRIHDVVGGNYPQYSVYAYALGLRISHNDIYDAPGQAILIGSNDVLIEYNRITDICKKMADAGAAYYYSMGALLGTTVRYNYFGSIGTNGGAAGTNYIYADGCAPGYEVYGNLFAGCNAAPIKAYQYTNIRNNIFLSSEVALVNGNIELEEPNIDYKPYELTRAQMRYCMMYGMVDNSSEQHYKDLIKNQADSEIYRDHYKGTIWEEYLGFWSPEKYDEYHKMDDADFLQMIKDENLGIPLSVRFDNNILYDVDYVSDDTDAISADEIGLHTDEEFRRSEDESKARGDMPNQCILGTNVRAEKEWFADYDGGDYSFTEAGLAAIKEILPGFEALPLDEMGTRTK